MIQPERLKSPTYRTWNGLTGADVWAMFQASSNGDLETVRSLVARDRRFVECEFEYRRPIRFAVSENHLGIVRLLLEHGADPTYDSYGDSLLTMARDRGHQEIEHLLERTLAERFHIGPDGERIASIVQSRDIETLRAALDEQPELIDSADKRGSKPIHWAVMTRQIQMIDELLNRGADINTRRPDGARPLDLTNGDYWYRGWRDVPDAAIQNHWVLAGYLLARGADYDISTAAKLGDLERVRLLLDEQPDLTSRVPPYSSFYAGPPLRCAARAGHTEIVRLLLERGADPNEPESIAEHGVALHNAVFGKHLEIARLLLEHGANPNADVDSSGSCMWAARSDPELLTLLGSYGGVLSLEHACYDGNLPHVSAMLGANPALPISEEAVHNATENGHQKILELMLRYQPHLLEAVRLGNAGSREMARWLLEHGTDVRRTNWLGITPLHRFAGNGQIEIAALCLEFGADINARDDEFRSTPLGWAARAGQLEMVTWLLQQAADPRLPLDKPWATPIRWAERHGHHDIADVLRRDTRPAR